MELLPLLCSFSGVLSLSLSLPDNSLAALSPPFSFFFSALSVSTLS